MSNEMTADQPRGSWAKRAAGLYDDAYARRYRDRDDQLEAVSSNQQLIDWLGSVCDRFDHSIDVLDLGCGTGRYFWGLRQVKSLTGLDASAPMLEEARRPIHAERLTATPITLLQGDLMSYAFATSSFDLVYSIGVLGEHVPFDLAIARRVHEWLVPGGRVAFTAVHRDSFSVPRTTGRRFAEVLLPVSPSFIGRPLRERLLSRGLYVDERHLHDVLGAAAFDVESIERYESDVHLHCLCVARKITA